MQQQYDQQALLRIILAMFHLFSGKGNKAPTSIPPKYLKMLEDNGYGKITNEGKSFELNPEGKSFADDCFDEFLDPDLGSMIEDFTASLIESGLFEEPEERPEPVREANTKKVYSLRITLTRIEPEIYREIDVPGYLSLEDLKEIIFLLFDWTGMHLFSYYINGFEYPAADDDIMHGFNQPFESKEELSRYQLSGTIGDLKDFIFIYDFGDDWEHEITVVNVREDEHFRVPQVLNITGNAPIEDIGGPYGLEEAELVLANKKHKEYKNYKSLFSEGTRKPAGSIEDYNQFLKKLFSETKLRLIKK